MKPTCTLLLSLLLTGPALAQELSEADQNLIKAVRDGGGQAMQLAKNDTRITIAFHLSDKEITDDTIKILAGASNVYSVNLRGTKVTDAGMAHVAGLKDLVRLHLEKTAITDAGIAQLKGLGKLEYLNVYGTVVSDAALKDVAALKSLKKLFVWETKVSEAGEEPLKAALPELEIVPDFKRDREKAILEASRAAEDAAKEMEELAA
ncbi:MAG: hypothetical protein ABGZ24_07130, partial [Fuerstiella sp.]